MSRVTDNQFMQINIYRCQDGEHWQGHKPKYPIKVQAVMWDDSGIVHDLLEVVTLDDDQLIHNAVRRLSSKMLGAK